MHRDTVAVYQDAAEEYRRAREATVARDRPRARSFARRADNGAPRADLGCGPGLYTGLLGRPVVALDASASMLDLARSTNPGASFVLADLELPPFRPGSLGGAWARYSYTHTRRSDLPLALARLHGTLAVGAPLDLLMIPGADEDGASFDGEDFPGRFFATWRPQSLRDVLVGAGYSVGRIEVRGPVLHAPARRRRSLPATVAEGMRVLVCGLNPSVHAADAGYGYAGPGNRFWPAALRARVVSTPRDPIGALRLDGVGMTDLVKRATRRAADLRAGEFRRGAARVRRIARWLRPAAVCFVGVSGYRAAVDPRAAVGWQPEPFAGVPTYVMPSTSGANARTGFAELVAHFRRVKEATR